MKYNYVPGNLKVWLFQTSPVYLKKKKKVQIYSKYLH